MILKKLDLKNELGQGRHSGYFFEIGMPTFTYADFLSRDSPSQGSFVIGPSSTIDICVQGDSTSLSSQ